MVGISVNPPQVKVGAPVVNLKMDPPQFNMDSAEFAGALDRMSQALVALSAQQATILQAIADLNQSIATMAGKQPNIEVQAPVVKMPARPRSYEVEIEDEKGDVTTMSIVANSPN